MSIYELLDYDGLLGRIGIPDQQDWCCGDNTPDLWEYNQENLTYDDIYRDPPGPDSTKGQPFGAAYDGRALHGRRWLCLTEDINVNGLLLNHRDRNGTIWLCTGIEGWWTLPPSEIPDVPKPYWDGSMLTTGRYLTRTITISRLLHPAGPVPGLVQPRRADPGRLDRARRRAARDVRQRASAPIDSPTTSTRPVLRPAEDGDHPDGRRAADRDHQAERVHPVLAVVPVRATPPSCRSTRGSRPSRSRSRARCGTSRPEVPPLRGVQRRDQWPTTPTAERARVIAPRVQRAGGRRRSAPRHPQVRRREALQPHQPDRGRGADDHDERHPTPTHRGRADTWCNKGNYFAFPIFVFEAMDFNDTRSTRTANQPVLTQDQFLEISNTATGETMRVVKDSGSGTGWRRHQHRAARRRHRARRVALVEPARPRVRDLWDWNARDYLTLDSEWITLAPGDNQLCRQQARRPVPRQPAHARTGATPGSADAMTSSATPHHARTPTRGGSARPSSAATSGIVRLDQAGQVPLRDGQRRAAPGEVIAVLPMTGGHLLGRHLRGHRDERHRLPARHVPRPDAAPARCTTTSAGRTPTRGMPLGSMFEVGNRAIYVMRNEEVVWGGILWTRSYSSGDHDDGDHRAVLGGLRLLPGAPQVGGLPDDHRQVHDLARGAEQMLHATSPGRATTAVDRQRGWQRRRRRAVDRQDAHGPGLTANRPLTHYGECWPNNSPPIELPPAGLSSRTRRRDDTKAFTTVEDRGAATTWTTSASSWSSGPTPTPWSTERRVRVPGAVLVRRAQERFRQRYTFGEMKYDTRPRRSPTTSGTPDRDRSTRCSDGDDDRPAKTIFDFPGHISDWSLTESMEEAATRVIVTGDVGEEADARSPSTQPHRPAAARHAATGATAGCSTTRSFSYETHVRTPVILGSAGPRRC